MDILVVNLTNILKAYERKKMKKKSSITPNQPTIQESQESETTSQRSRPGKPTKSPREESPSTPVEASMAEKYEKWQSLMKEKELARIKGHEEGHFAKTEEREDLFNIAKTSMSSKNSKSPRASNLSPRPQKNTIQTQKSNLSAKEIEEMTERLYISGRFRDQKVENMRQEKLAEQK
jgi:hypothetical protein